MQGETWGNRWVVVAVTTFVVVLCVLMHYEAFSLLTGLLKRVHMPQRPKILLLIFSILLIHVADIWVFGSAYYVLTAFQGYGALVAGYTVGFLDSIYFSAVCYTTLGLGDVVPTGAVRFLAGVEALSGFVLITWSASFTFLEMERFWRT
ncbi:MAG: two pore domain potassium channel family protein [Gammaproteobacteria bacterium]|nr:two pore domain potassium channel family protein [Gammaproteobacteria bacterium]